MLPFEKNAKNEWINTNMKYFVLIKLITQQINLSSLEKRYLDMFSTLGFELVMQLCKQIIINNNDCPQNPWKKISKLVRQKTHI